MGLQDREGALFFATGIDNSGLVAGKAQAVGILRGFASQVSALDVFAGLTAGATMAFKRIAVESKQMSMAYQQAMLEVLTISGAMKKDFEGYNDEIVDMSRKLPQSAVELAKAYYQIVSAGYDGAAGLELLRAASQSAVGGVTDVTTAADGLTTVLNAWNISAERSSQVADIFFTAVRLGKTTFGELAANISQAAPLASASNVKFEQIAAAIATITKQGAPTNMAVTQIRQALVSLNEVLGEGWANTYTFQEALVEVERQARASGKSLQEYIGGRVESLQAVLALTGKNAKMAASDLDEMTRAAGSASAAFDDMMKSDVNQSKILKNNINAALKPLGDWMASKATGFARTMNEAFDTGAISEYARYMGILSATIAAYTLTANGAAVSTKLLNAAIKAATFSIRGIKAAFASNPIGLIAVGVATAATAIMAYKKNTDELGEASARLTKSIGSEVFSANSLFESLKKAKKGTEEWNKARELINTRYGQYLGHLLDEKTALEDIETAQKRVTQALIANAGVKAYGDQLSAMMTDYQDKFSKELGSFTEAYARYNGADRLPDFITAINTAIEKQIQEGGGKVERGMLEYSQIATDLYNQFINDMSRQTGYVKYSYDDFIDSFLDLAQFKAKQDPITKYIEGMVQAWQNQLDKLTPVDPIGGNGGGGGGGGENGVTTYYQSIIDKIEELRKEQILLSGSDDAMSQTQIAANKELLKYYEERKKAIEELLGLTEKEQVTTFDPGSIGALEQEINKLQENYIKVTTQAERDAIQSRIDAKQEELDAMRGITQDKIDIEENYYDKIKTKSYQWLRDELSRLKKLKAEKENLFKNGENLSRDEKKSILQDLKDISDGISSVESEISNDLYDAVHLVNKSFNAMAEVISEINQEAGETVSKIGNIVSGAGELLLGLSSGNPLAVASGVISLTQAMIEMSIIETKGAENYAEALREVNLQLNEQSRILSQSDRYGNKSAQYREEIALLKEQAELIRKSIEAEKNRQKFIGGVGFDAMDEEVLKQLEDQLIEVENQISDTQQEWTDFMAGLVTETDLAGQIADAFAAGKTSAKELGDYVNNILKDAILNVFKGAILGKYLTEATNYLSSALEDMVFTQAEVDAFTGMVTGAAEKFAPIWQQLTQALPNLFNEDAANSLTGAIRAQLTEDTGSLLAGTMNAIRLDSRNLVNIQLDAIELLAQIARNTLPNSNLIQIANDIQAIKSSLTNFSA